METSLTMMWQSVTSDICICWSIKVITTMDEEANKY